MQDSAQLLQHFRASIAGDHPIPALRAGLIGKTAMVAGPFGARRMLYADYVASGRALRQVEDFVLEQVLPYYANSHTDASFCGKFVTDLRAAARAEIAQLTGATSAHSVIFTGSGATAGLNRLIHLFGVHEAVASGRGATVLIGPYEHHSNILPWRESGANVIEIPEGPMGGPDMEALDAALETARGLVIGSFSAASNVSGILTDVVAVTRRLKAAGALAVWDYAGGGPYLPIRMTPASDAPIDAIALSPHKFVGGPAASGLLLVRNDAVSARVPTFPGGGTVRFVTPASHDYLDSIEEREEGGTPNLLADIRAALAMIVKDVVGEARIVAIDRANALRTTDALARMDRITLLGRTDCARLPIFSLMIGTPANPIDPQMATRLLSDFHGIQARGGCACAGPYGHQLLGIDDAASDRLRARVLGGDEAAKPGFVRFNISYLMDEAEIARITDAIRTLPDLCLAHAHLYAPTQPEMPAFRRGA